jgi:hypothetical protein
MQHCGEPNGDMYSLRDANSKPHVTADIYDDPDYGGLLLVQCKGKQNAAPDRRWWPAVLELLKRVGARPSPNGGSSDAEDGLFDWLHDRLETERAERDGEAWHGGGD